MQDAVGALLQSSKIDTLQSQKLHPGLPPTWIRASALLNLWVKSQSPAAVHPIPTWRPTDSSSDLSGADEDEQNPPEDLVTAAMYLLQDSTLGGDSSVPKTEQQQQKQPGWDWGELVQRQLQTQASVAASSKLLATRNAVPSHSARLVFASQVRTRARFFCMEICTSCFGMSCTIAASSNNQAATTVYSLTIYAGECLSRLLQDTQHHLQDTSCTSHLPVVTTACWALVSEHKTAVCTCPVALV